MSTKNIPDRISASVTKLLTEIPALAPMKFSFVLYLKARGDLQLYRVDLPGSKVSKVDDPGDAMVRVEMQRVFFNAMIDEGKIADWQEAFRYGQARASGPPQILKLIRHVVNKHQERLRLQMQPKGKDKSL